MQQQQEVINHRRVTLKLGDVEPNPTNKRRRLETSTTTTPNEKFQVTEEGDSAPLLVYPPRRGGTALFEVDMARLQDGIYLNDRVVNILAAWAVDNCLREEKKQEIQVCDSFLYSQLTRGVNPVSLKEPSAALLENFKRVQGYRRQKGPGDREVTVIPICEDQHWFLLLMFIRKTTAEHQVVIFIMDSLPMANREHAANILKWYMEDSLHEPVQTVIRVLQVTRQTNLYDCGLHVIHNISRTLEFINTHASLDEENLRQVLNMEPCPISRIRIKEILGDLIAGKTSTPEPTISRTSQSAETIVLDIPGGHLISLDGKTVLENQVTGTDWELTEGDLAEIVDILSKAQEKFKQQPRSRRLRFLRQIRNTVVAFRLFRGTQYSRIMRTTYPAMMQDC